MNDKPGGVRWARESEIEHKFTALAFLAYFGNRRVVARRLGLTVTGITARLHRINARRGVILRRLPSPNASFVPELTPDGVGWLLSDWRELWRKIDAAGK